MHVHFVVYCGAKMVLFTNKSSGCWCHIINPYPFTKFHTSKHSGERVTQTCMFTLFFVVVRKGYCLPTNYQNVGVVSLIPTCFIHPSILVRELHKLACSIVWAEVVYCGISKSKVFTNMRIPCASPKSISLPNFICGCTPVNEIREFNQKTKKKKMNNSEKGFFECDTFSIIQSNPFLTNRIFDGIVTMM